MSNLIINIILAFFAKKIKLEDKFNCGLLGRLSRSDINAITKELRINGFYIHNNLVSQKLCDELENFARTTKLIATDDDGNCEYVDKYPDGNPRSLLYEASESDLFNEELVQNLCADVSFLKIAQEYLRCAPKLNFLSMWWSTAYKKSETDINSAQNWHFDMENPKFLKIFIFLTDVDEKNGAHQYAEGTNRPLGIPREILDLEYSRIPNEVIERNIGKDKIKLVKGKRGTILIEDTSGMHRGGRVLMGDRLVLQFHFANTCFGSIGSLEKVNNFEPKSESLINLMSLYPEVYPKLTYSALNKVR